jgi:hypothetical protein
VVWDRDVKDICNKFFPEEVVSGVLPLEGSLTAIKWRLDAQSTEDTFGWQFTSFEETLKGLVSQYLRLEGKSTS